MLLLLAGTTALARPDLALAYHGHVFTHPGASARLAWRGDQRVALQPEAEVGSWVHPRHQVAVYARGGVSLSHHGKRGGRHELFAHLGAQRSTWIVPTYRVDGDEMARRALSGQGWLVGTAGMSLGRNAWFVRPQVSLRGPHFHGFGSDFAVQVGAFLGGGR
ncbi:MAG: hypothetical protein AAF602_07095 [Myxococcota bacterium]